MSPFPNCPVGGQAPPPLRAPSPSPGKARAARTGFAIVPSPAPILAGPCPTVVAMRFVLFCLLWEAGAASRSAVAPSPAALPATECLRRRRASISPTLLRKRRAVSRRLLRLSILPHYLPRSTSPPRRAAASPALCRKGEVRFPVEPLLSRHFPPSPSGPNPPPSRQAAVPPSPGKAGSGSLWGFPSRSLPLPFRDPPHAR